MSAPVLMTLPKYVTIPNNNGLPVSTNDPIDEFLVCGKKRRLDHLTWEEKLQRKYVSFKQFFEYFFCIEN